MSDRFSVGTRQAKAFFCAKCAFVEVNCLRRALYAEVRCYGMKSIGDGFCVHCQFSFMQLIRFSIPVFLLTSDFQSSQQSLRRSLLLVLYRIAAEQKQPCSWRGAGPSRI